MKRFISKTYINALRDLTAFGGFSIVILLPILILGYESIDRLIKIYLGLFILEFIVSAIKYIFFKNRPVPIQYDDVVDKIFCSASFPSAHVSRSVFIFLTLYLYYQQNIFFLLMIILVMITRRELHKHFIVDIIAGFIISGLFTIAYWQYINF